MTTVTLALDISSVSTGWSIFKNYELYKYGKIETKKIKTHSERLVFFEEEINKLYEQYKPNSFVAEDVFVGKSPKVHKLLSLYHGVAYKIGFQKLGVDPLVLYESEIRNIIGETFDVVLRKQGKEGKKAKELTFDFIDDKYNLDLDFKKDNDITDAIAVGLAVSILGEKDEGSLGSFRGCARSKPKRNKKSVSKASTRKPPRQKPRKRKSRRKVQGGK